MSGVVFVLLLLGIGIFSGIISAAAGLASLVSYPSLLALGLPPVIANVTSAFSTITGNYSSVFSSFKELEHNRRQLWIILPLVFAGSIIGAFLLFAVPSKWFAELVPLCIALAGIILLFPHHPKQRRRPGIIPATGARRSYPVSSRHSLPGRLPGLLYRVRQGLFCVIRAAYVDSLDVLGMFWSKPGKEKDILQVSRRHHDVQLSILGGFVDVAVGSIQINRSA